MAVFNNNIREWRHKTTNLKTWLHYKLFLRQAHQEKIRVVTIAGKGGYTAAVQNIYGVLPPPTEENHETINSIHTIFQGTQIQT